jgi:paraquat-inducible protein A
MSSLKLIACHECDLLHHGVALAPGARARCKRCGAVLYRRSKGTLDHTLAWSVAALVLLMLANAFPIVSLQVGGDETQASLLGGARALYAQGMFAVAGLVLLTLVVAPALVFSLLIYLFAPMRFGRLALGFTPLFRFARKLGPWQMFDVFILGIIVSVVKLSHLASVVPGVGLWAFLALMFASIIATASYDTHTVWDRANASMEGVTLARMPAGASR